MMTVIGLFMIGSALVGLAADRLLPEHPRQSDVVGSSVEEDHH